MYVRPNFKTKKELKLALEKGKHVSVFCPAGIGTVPVDGTVYLEGPHGGAHTWYAQGKMVSGKLTEVK